jgi:hypothetical protein
MAFFQIQESPSVFVNTDYVERFHFAYDPEATDTGTLTIHFVSGETLTFTGAHGLAGYESLIEVLGEEDVDVD